MIVIRIAPTRQDGASMRVDHATLSSLAAGGGGYTNISAVARTQIAPRPAAITWSCTLAAFSARRDNPRLRWTHSSARLERLPHMPFRAISHTNPIRKTPKNQGRSDPAGDGRQLSPNEPTAQN